MYMKSAKYIFVHIYIIYIILVSKISYAMTSFTILQGTNKPKPQPRQKLPPPGPSAPPALPDLPNVPNDLPEITADETKPSNTDNDEIDFDDLSRRFENLKKRK
uniref:Uncharacterized protein n=1 Tax=Ceratitis capitata TaxID=7213 RepID=W8CD13_CERCA